MLVRVTCLCLVIAIGAVAAAVEPNRANNVDAVPPWDKVATFSILGYDPDTGEVGGAVQSRVFCVGNGVIAAEAGVGAVATQASADIGYGPQALALLKQGMAPADVVKKVWDDDPDPQPRDWSKNARQLAVINVKGEAAAFTGEKDQPWAGHKIGKNCTA